MTKITGCTAPRIFTKPLRELTPETSLGFLFADFCREMLGIELVPWQRWLAIHAMEIIGDLDTGWRFRFRVILAIIARQQGKSYFLALMADFCLYVLGIDLVLGTAQNIETAEEVWEEAIAHAEGNAEMKARIARVRRSNGGKSFELDTGGKYKIAASSRKGARGKRSDLIIMDELREQQTWEGWAAISKTMMARPNAQLWAVTNAGDGSSVVLNHLRAIGHAALGDPDGICADSGMEDAEDMDMDDDSVFIAEWSADPCLDITDPDGFELAVRQANPSLGYGFVTMRALKSAYRTDPPDVFATECLCRWVEAKAEPPFPEGAWESGIDSSSVIAPDSPIAYGIDISGDREVSSIAAAGWRADRDAHVEVIARQKGVGWVRDWLLQRANPDAPLRVALQGRGAPVSSIAEILATIEGVEVIECAGREVAGWTGAFYDGVCACLDGGDEDIPRIVHRPQPALDMAAQTAAKRSLGDGAFAFDRTKSGADAAPLIACVMAYGALGKREPAAKPSVYEDAGVMFL